MNFFEIRSLLEVARGDKPADLVINGRILSVFTGETIEADVAIYDQYIAGIGSYEGKKRIETEFYILPGFVDAHMHLESTLLNPAEFVKAVLPHGTTSVVIDPHEIANVAGSAGIKYLIKATENLPLNFFFTVPSCVPAIKGFETFGAEITAEDIQEILQYKNVVGLAEVMNFPGVVYGDEEVLKKLKTVENKIANGHAPRLMGKDLNAYLSAGIRSDHECSSTEEAIEKLRLGMKIMIREGSVAKNLVELVKAVKEISSENFLLASDDLLPIDLLNEGHMDYRLKLCVEHGINPEIAVKMVTINTARHFKLDDIGAVAPGYKADIVVVEDLKSFKVVFVIKDGKIAWDGELRLNVKSLEPPEDIKRSVKMPPLLKEDLIIEAKGGVCRLIELIPEQIITKHVRWEPIVKNGFALPDPEQDIAKVAVVDRHRREKKIGLGFVKGFGIEIGALASSVGHDSHNCICVGVSDEDMLVALKRLEELQGGFVAVKEGRVKAELPLPIAGLMSELPFKEVAEKLEKLYEVARELGVSLKHPFTSLSFLPLPVIPELRITDFGLVDVNEMRIVSLWVM